MKFFFFLQSKAPKEIHAILTDTLLCFLPGRAKDLSAFLYIKLSVHSQMELHMHSMYVGTSGVSEIVLYFTGTRRRPNLI